MLYFHFFYFAGTSRLDADPAQLARHTDRVARHRRRPRSHRVLRSCSEDRRRSQPLFCPFNTTDRQKATLICLYLVRRLAKSAVKT